MSSVLMAGPDTKAFSLGLASLAPLDLPICYHRTYCRSAIQKSFRAAIDAFYRSIAGNVGSSKPAIEALARYKLGNCCVIGRRREAVREYHTVVRMDVNFYGAVDSARKYLQKPDVESK